MNLCYLCGIVKILFYCLFLVIVGCRTSETPPIVAYYKGEQPILDGSKKLIDEILSDPYSLLMIVFFSESQPESMRYCPVLEELNENYQTLTVIKVNVEKHKAYARSQGIQTLPETRLYFNQKPFNRFVGKRDLSELRVILESFEPIEELLQYQVSQNDAEAFTQSLARSIEENRRKTFSFPWSRSKKDPKIEDLPPISPREKQPIRLERSVEERMRRADGTWLPPGVKRARIPIDSTLDK